MAAIKGHSSYTFNHMVNGCILAIAFGRRLGLKRKNLAVPGPCALYHDMGKLQIPLEILNKAMELTEEECRRDPGRRSIPGFRCSSSSWV